MIDFLLTLNLMLLLSSLASAANFRFTHVATPRTRRKPTSGGQIRKWKREQEQTLIVEPTMPE